MADRLLTADDVAERLNVKKSTVYSWVYGRRVPFLKLAQGRALRFRECDLQRMLEDAVHQPEEVRVDV